MQGLEKIGMIKLWWIDWFRIQKFLIYPLHQSTIKTYSQHNSYKIIWLYHLRFPFLTWTFTLAIYFDFLIFLTLILIFLFFKHSFFWPFFLEKGYWFYINFIINVTTNFSQIGVQIFFQNSCCIHFSFALKRYSIFSDFLGKIGLKLSF